MNARLATSRMRVANLALFRLPQNVHARTVVKEYLFLLDYSAKIADLSIAIATAPREEGCVMEPAQLFHRRPLPLHRPMGGVVE